MEILSRYFGPAVAGGLAAFAAVWLAPRGLQAESVKVVTLEPRETDEQLWLEGEPASTHFDGRGVVVYGGISHRFLIPPKFALFTDPKRDPRNGYGYPTVREMEPWELSNAERYPIQVRDMESPSIEGFSVHGVQSRDLPWRVVKNLWDGDGIVVRHCTGRAVVRNMVMENVEDGFGPQEHLDAWSLSGTYMRYIRDDAIENDDLISGQIDDCLIDGCFVFLSHRPDEERPSTVVTQIRNTLVHVQAQPHDGVENRPWRDRNITIGDDGIGRAPGMLFKWYGGGGSVVVENCVFLVDGVAFSGPGDMRFPPGKYRNVTLIWRGQGNYPAPLPRGVKETRDISLWERAREAWIGKLAPDHPAYAVLVAPEEQNSSSPLSHSEPIPPRTP